jgi:hypothetical protein
VFGWLVLLKLLGLMERLELAMVSVLGSYFAAAGAA